MRKVVLGDDFWVEVPKIMVFLSSDGSNEYWGGESGVACGFAVRGIF